MRYRLQPEITGSVGHVEHVDMQVGMQVTSHGTGEVKVRLRHEYVFHNKDVLFAQGTMGRGERVACAALCAHGSRLSRGDAPKPDESLRNKT